MKGSRCEPTPARVAVSLQGQGHAVVVAQALGSPEGGQASKERLFPAHSEASNRCLCRQSPTASCLQGAPAASWPCLGSMGPSTLRAKGPSSVPRYEALGSHSHPPPSGSSLHLGMGAGLSAGQSQRDSPENFRGLHLPPSSTEPAVSEAV